jgi:hypothetical protein
MYRQYGSDIGCTDGKNVIEGTIRGGRLQTPQFPILGGFSVIGGDSDVIAVVYLRPSGDSMYVR